MLNPSWTVLVTDTITVPAGCMLNGQGATIRYRGEGGIANSLLDLTGADGATLRDVVLDGDGLCYSGWLAAGVNDVRMERVTFKNFRHLGWRTSQESHRIQCVDCTFQNIRGATEVPNAAITPSYCFDTVITRCTFDDVGDKLGDWAIYDSGTSGAMTITHNTIRNCTGGIKVHTKNWVSDARVVSDNDIEVTLRGIWLKYLTNITVENNTVACGERGIEVFNCSGQVADNVIYCGGEMGVYIGEGNVDLAARRNGIFAAEGTTPGSGIYLGSDSKNTVLDSNIISGFNIGVFSPPSLIDGVLVQGNTISKANKYAVLFAGGKNLSFIANTISGAEFALWLEGVEAAQITKNTLNPPLTKLAMLSRVAAVYVWDNIDNVGINIHSSSTGEWYLTPPPA